MKILSFFLGLRNVFLRKILINEIDNGKRGITPSTALRLAKFFGVSSDFWLNLQLAGISIMSNSRKESRFSGFKFSTKFLDLS